MNPELAAEENEQKLEDVKRMLDAQLDELSEEQLLMLHNRSQSIASQATDASSTEGSADEDSKPPEIASSNKDDRQTYKPKKLKHIDVTQNPKKSKDDEPRKGTPL